MTQSARRALPLWTLLLVVLPAVTTGGPRAQDPAPGTWHTFEGSWSAVGQRHSLPTESAGRATIIQLSGAITITSATGLSRGFRGEAIGFNDGQQLSAGRAMWTDAQGDRVFSVLKGEAIGTGRRILGTITGGTGRYANASGDYALVWQYVVQADDDAAPLQGRAVDLRGRLRTGDARR